MIDVERWREWTPSIKSIEALDGRELRVGGRFRIRQPKFPAAVWRVTALDPGHYFEWESTGPGLKMTAGHRLEAKDGRTRATLTVRQEGPIGALMGRLLETKVSRRYMEMEAQGLKRRCENT